MGSLEEHSDITVDTISEGEIEVLQRESGYRFGLDAVLLATDLPELPASPTIVELGAGQGVVSLCVANRIEDAEVVAVERQESLYELLVEGVERNRLESRIEAVCADIRAHRDILEPHRADLVLCNPPYYRQGERRTSDDAERAAARNELAGTLADFVHAAQYILEQRGRLKMIVPPLRLRDFYAAIDATDFSIESIRFFHSRRNEDAYLLEVVTRRGGAPDVRVRPPLYVYEGEDYGTEVRDRIDRAGVPT